MQCRDSISETLELVCARCWPVRVGGRVICPYAHLALSYAILHFGARCSAIYPTLFRTLILAAIQSYDVSAFKHCSFAIQKLRGSCKGPLPFQVSFRTLVRGPWPLPSLVCWISPLFCCSHHPCFRFGNLQCFCVAICI